MGLCGTKSIVQSLVFPAPENSSYGEWSFQGELLWIPLGQCLQLSETYKNHPEHDYVFPCRLLQTKGAKNLIIYFHKNADDLGTCRWLCEKLCKALSVHVLIVEYPGYGLCWDSPKNAEQMTRHAFAALAFAHHALGLQFEDIILFGSCIGVGPAIAVASQIQVGGVILVGAYLSVRKMVKTHSRFASLLVADMFPNEDVAHLIKSPTLMFHGKLDKLIPMTHAELLYDRLNCRKKLVSLDNVGHNVNSVAADDFLLPPINEFIDLSNTVEYTLSVPQWAFSRKKASNVDMTSVSTFQSRSVMAPKAQDMNRGTDEQGQTSSSTEFPTTL